MSENEITIKSGGQGEGPAVLVDAHRTKSDINLISRAVREGWNVPVEGRAIVVRRLLGVVAKTSVDVMTKEGPANMEGPADQNAVAASRVLVAMDAVNQTDYWNQDKNERLDSGKATERVGIAPVVIEQAIERPQDAKSNNLP